MNSDEQHQADAVEHPGLLAHRPQRQPQGQQHGQQAERQVDEEDAAPAEGVRQISADHRAEYAGRHHHGGEVALVAGPLARRHALADQRLRERHQPAAAETLQHPRGGQHLDAGGDRAKQGGDQEHRQRHQHHAPAAVDVAQLAIQRRRHRGGDQVGHHHPRHPVDAAERGGDGRQGGRHDGLVHHRQEHRQHDRRVERQERGGRRLWLDVVSHGAALPGACRCCARSRSRTVPDQATLLREDAAEAHPAADAGMPITATGARRCLLDHNGQLVELGIVRCRPAAEPDALFDFAPADADVGQQAIIQSLQLADVLRCRCQRTTP